MTTTPDVEQASTRGDDRPVVLGHAIFALHEPHPGHEVRFNRFYERDHQFVALFAPWTMGTRRWVATRALKDLRIGATDASVTPFGMPIDRGSYLTTFFIQDQKLEEQQRWVSEYSVDLEKDGRTFQERDVMTATIYDCVGERRRDDDGVPAELVAQHPFEGLVWTVLERTGDESLDDVRDRVLAALGTELAGTPAATTLAFTPLPKLPWWPAAAPEVPGVGERLVLATYLESPPTECWDRMAGVRETIDGTGAARTLLVAPFVPTVPGTDRYCDELF
jgi:hypothetical protein